MDDVVVDACCLINLCAAGELRERLSLIGGKWYIPTAVLAESLYLHIEQVNGTIDKSPKEHLQVHVPWGDRLQFLATCQVARQSSAYWHAKHVLPQGAC